MNTIGGLTAIVHRLRARRTGRKNIAAGKAAIKSQPSGIASAQEIRPMLAARLAVLDLTTPAMQEHAVDMFVETTLNREFGASLLEQETMQDLVFQVRQALICTPEGRKAVLEMLHAMRQLSIR